MRFTAIICSLIILTMTARADRERWVETNQWSGTGMKTTAAFLVGGKAWRVVARRTGATPNVVRVLKKDGECVAEVRAVKEGIIALQTLQGPGVFHISVPDSDGPWTVRVIQKMSITEEWNFRQEIKKPLPPLKKISVFSGENAMDRFKFSVPPSKSWKLVCTGKKGEDGTLVLRVAQLGTRKKNGFHYEAGQTVDCTQWFLAGGEFELAVDAEKTAWRIEVLTE